MAAVMLQRGLDQTPLHLLQADPHRHALVGAGVALGTRYSGSGWGDQPAAKLVGRHAPPVVVSTLARVMMFSNSRTLPGQW